MRVFGGCEAMVVGMASDRQTPETAYGPDTIGRWPVLLAAWVAILAGGCQNAEPTRRAPEEARLPAVVEAEAADWDSEVEQRRINERIDELIRRGAIGVRLGRIPPDVERAMQGGRGDVPIFGYPQRGWELDEIASSPGTHVGGNLSFEGGFSFEDASVGDE